MEYLADVGRSVDENAINRRAALTAAFTAINTYEQKLADHLLSGLETIAGVRVWGITDRERLSERVPTVSITIDGHSPAKIAEPLGERGLYVWAGNHYALPYTEAAGLEPGGTLRIGLMHYNTIEEIDRLVNALREVVA